MALGWICSRVPLQSKVRGGRVSLRILGLSIESRRAFGL